MPVVQFTLNIAHDRPLRIELVNAVNHVTSRGDRREAVCRNDADWPIAATAFRRCTVPIASAE